MFYVTSITNCADAIEALTPSRVMSLMPREEVDAVLLMPSSISPDRHLKVDINDIVESLPGLTAPESHHMDAILSFFRSWHEARMAGSETGGIIIHCRMGISRSSAAAYAGLCLLGKVGREHEIARYMRDQGAHFQPNSRMVRLCDTLLNRNGRMVAAVESMGQGSGLNHTAWVDLDPDQYAT